MIKYLKTFVELALVDAGRAEYLRLTGQHSRKQRELLVDRALEQLGLLQSDNQSPDYRKPEVALFYSLWYLPSQVNLAVAAVRPLLQPSRDLAIIDFGSGTGALAIGAALVLASLDPRRAPRRVVIHGVDCVEMTGFGDRIWSALEQTADERSTQLKAALARIERRNHHTTNDTIQAFMGRRTDGAFTALSALHVAYGQNADEVARSLRQVWASIQPDVGVLTAPDIGRKPEIAKRIAPWQANAHCVPSLELDGKLQELTDLRREMRRGLGMDWGNGWLLENAVNWKPRVVPVMYRYPVDSGGGS